MRPKFSNPATPLKASSLTVQLPTKKETGDHTLDTKDCLDSLEKVVPSPEKKHQLSRGHEHRSGNLMFNNIANIASRNIEGPEKRLSTNPYVSSVEHTRRNKSHFDARAYKTEAAKSVQ